jgi:hypothetical protein
MNGNLCGYVVRGQRAVPDAAITIVEGAGRHVDLAPVSDADGWFALDDLPAGYWRLRAVSSDGASGEAGVEIWDDSLSEVTISLDDISERRPDIWREPNSDDESDRQPFEGRRPGADDSRDHAGGRSPAFGSVFGRVTDEVTGRPVSDALVVVTDGPGPLPDAVVLTDADGGFSIPALEPGNWALEVDADDSGHGQLVVAVLSGRRVNVEVALVQTQAEEGRT